MTGVQTCALPICKGTGATDGLDDGDALGKGTGATDGLDDGDALGAAIGGVDVGCLLGVTIACLRWLHYCEICGLVRTYYI